ncbi:Fluconazole resistance protein 3 [Candida viswanathii]|uniref:Fluconazole resistance protein 3 n=1 Tax=Candida viswanathii TaxID=5486 RepID=A0A367YH40_9ASCO|nr:Fluconazole resistance protein 3 [Candida viswanathii]
MPPKTEYWNHEQPISNLATAAAINPLFDGQDELHLENIPLTNQLHQHPGNASLFNPSFTAPASIPHSQTRSGYQYNNDIHDDNFVVESKQNGTNLYLPSSLSTSPQITAGAPYHQNSLTDASTYRQNSLPESVHGSTMPRLTSRQNSVTEVAGITKPSKRGSSQRSKRQMLDEQDAILIARDDSELTEEELQLKRKAQNRAAQRAFRERKETKLKELEAKLLQSEEERQKLMDQLEIIRKQNISITTENEILRSSGDIHSGGTFPARHPHITPVNKFNFPKTQDDFIEHVLRGTNHKLKEENKNKVYADNNGCKLLALGAVWDYLQIKAEEADLDFNSIDFNDVMERLKGAERCHGYGPAYPLELVNQAIESSLN